MSQLSRIIKLATAGPGQPFQIFAKNFADSFRYADEADATHITGGSATDSYPGGLTVADPYAALATWYVDDAVGSDAGSGHAAGYTYKTYDAALLDVFPIGNPGNRRIILKSTGTYYPGGSQTSQRGSYFPAGGPDASHPCVIQGDPSSTTFPTIDGQLNHACFITGVTRGVTTLVTFGNPISGPAVNPFSSGDTITINPPNNTNVPIVGLTNGTLHFSGTVATVSSPGGSSGAWTVVLNFDSSAYTAWVSGGGIQLDMGRAAFAIGHKGDGATSAPASNLVIRKIEIINSSTGPAVDYRIGTSANITVEYCSFHGLRYNWSNPSSSGAISVANFNITSNWLIQNCNFYDMGTRPGEVTTSGASNWSLNCVPIETYGTDTVTIRNCKFDEVYVGIRTKQFDGGGVGGSGTANNWNILHNIFSRCYDGIIQGTNGNGFVANSNWTVSYNLFYGPSHPVGANSPLANAGFTWNQGSNIVLTNNTIAEDMSDGLHWMGATGVVYKDNVDLSTGNGYWVDFDPLDAAYHGANNAIVFTTLDYNVYFQRAAWILSWIQTNYNSSTHPFSKYKYTTFAAWQAANTTPLNESGAGTSPAPPEFASIGNPDAHALWIPSLGGGFTTLAANFTNVATRDYSIKAGSPLLTASSTGGKVGYDPTNIGPGW